MAPQSVVFKFDCPACFESLEVEARRTDEVARGHVDCECGHRIFVKDRRDPDRKVGDLINGDVTPTITIEFNEVEHD